jgi:D-alanyl-D-alanine dipeptidase
MPCKKIAVCALLMLPFLLNAQFGPPLRESLSQSSQMVVVTTKGWTNIDGTMRRYERTERGWEQIGSSVPVTVGRSGLGWGLGMTNPPLASDPEKREGDGRSPAGIFPLTYAFGWAPADEVKDLKLPYVQCTGTLECVDDTNSMYYNIVKDRNAAPKVDWKSSEHMRIDSYKWGVFIANNTGPATPGYGSCVFMHIWRGPDRPTTGCTAMSTGNIESLLGWLDARPPPLGAHPVLVQLPQEQYMKYQVSWLLPAIQFDP